jgi:asparagine synthase (glutamine-hydrolysing)
MCGIVAVLGSSEQPEELRSKVLAQAKLLRHRGPDWSGIRVQQLQKPDGRRIVNILAHERLSIVAPEEGAQPLLSEDGAIALSVNGEIYNHKELRQKLLARHTFATHSDCEPILHLYEDQGPDFVGELDGDFAFVLADEKTGEVLAARDPIGVVPLYWGWDKHGTVWFASEMKALCAVCQRFEQFPPGHLFYKGKLTRYFNPSWRDTTGIPAQSLAPQELAAALEQSVVKRLMSDVPYGVLLSGGLDSSVVAAIVARHAALRVEEDN